MACCTGINGSHTQICEVGLGSDTLTCWAGQHEYPAGWCCLWSDKGSRCFEHEDVAVASPVMACAG